MRRRRPAPFRYFLFLLILLLIILGGCVSKSHWVWKNPEKLTELELLKDKQTCRDLARLETSQINYYYNYSPFGAPFGFPSYAPYYYDRYRYRCPFFNNGHYFQRQDDLKRFYRVCMKAKGWKRVEIEEKKE
jgi:hypothetical protein